MPAERSLISAGSKQLAKTAQTQQTLPPWLISHYRKRREDHERWSEPGTPFPVGQKKVFLYVALSNPLQSFFYHTDTNHPY